MQNFRDEEFLRQFFSNLGFKDEEIEKLIKNYIEFKEKRHQEEIEDFIMDARMILEDNKSYFETRNKEITIKKDKNQKRREIYLRHSSSRTKVRLRILLKELDFDTIQELPIWLTAQTDLSIYPIQDKDVRFDQKGLRHEISPEVVQYIEVIKDLF